MASESGACRSSSKRHNPVDSICRKIKTIKMRTQEGNPILQIPKFQSRNFDSPQNSEKKNLEVVLKNRTIKSCDRDSSTSLSSPVRDSVYSKAVSPRFVPVSDYHSPLSNATYSIILATKEKALNPWWPRRSMSCSTPLTQNYGLNYGLRSCSTPSLELMSCIAEDGNAKISPSFSMSGTKSECIAFRSPLVRSPVVKRLSLNEGGLRRAGEMKKESTEVSLICEEDLLDCIFQACDLEHRGKVPVSKIVDYLRHTTSRGSEDSGLDDLCNMLDPDKKDISLDLDTYQAIMKEFIEECRNNGGDATTKEEIEDAVCIEDSVFKMPGSFLAKRRSGGMNTTYGSLEANGGDVSKGDLETSDLITNLADLQLNNQKMEMQHGKLKLALEGAEEANNRLLDEIEMLRAQMKNAHQYISRAKALKEELDEVKGNLGSLEEKKAKVLAQNKQLEKENVSLIHNISSLQEENIQNAVDLDVLQKKIDELLGNVAELQMQLQDYETIMTKKDASFHKQELHIEELKSSVSEYASVIEALRAEKAKLEKNMQQMHQELISHGIDSPIARTFSQSSPDEKTSLHSEMELADHSPETHAGDNMKYSFKPMPNLEETFDHEVLLLLQSPGQEKASTEFKMIVQKLQEDACNVAELLLASLQQVMESEMNPKAMHEKIYDIIKRELKTKRIHWIQMLKTLQKHKGSLDLEFAKVSGNLRRLKTEHLHLTKTLSSRVHDLETLKQQHEEDAEKVVALEQQLQDATKKCEDARRLVLERDEALHSAREEAESARRKLEEALSSQQALKAINNTLASASQALEEKRKEQQVSLDALREKLLTAQVCGLLCQDCASGSPADERSLAKHDISQDKSEADTRHCRCRRFGIHQAFCPVESQKSERGSHTACWYTPLLDALTLDVLRLHPPLQHSVDRWTSLSTFEKAELPLKTLAAHDNTLCNSKGYDVLSVAIQTDAGHPVTTTMELEFSEEKGDQLILKVAKIDCSRDLAPIEKQDIVPAISESTIVSSEQDSVPLDMEMKSDTSNMPQSGNEKAVVQEGEKETDNGAIDVSDAKLHENSNQLGTIGIQGETSPLGILKLNLENSGEEAAVEKATEDSTETAAAEGKISDLVASSNIAKFGKNNNSPSEREMETEFLRLSLGFKCDLFTLDKRLRLEERSRDLAEENLKKEISNCLKLLETLAPVCEEDNQSQEIIKKLEKSLQFLSQHTACVASRAEMLGAIHQESLVSKAVDVMIQHVENLKRMYATEHAELEELKIVLKNEKSFGYLMDEDDSLSKKLTSSNSSKVEITDLITLQQEELRPLSRTQNLSIAVFGRFRARASKGKQGKQKKNPSGKVALSRFLQVQGALSLVCLWRAVGSENRPSLQRLISTSPWADEEEYCTKGNEQGPLSEEVKTKKCYMEGNKLKPNAQVHSMSSWVDHFRTSFSKANKTLWASVLVVMFLAVLGSFIAGMCFQRPADAAPIGIGVSWTSLQQLLWPYTGLRHNAQPPV